MKKRECYIGMDGYCHVPLANGKGETICDASRINEVNKYNWSLSDCGYAVTRINHKTISIHRLLFPFFKIIDHINRNKLDNIDCNIREATCAENSRNRSCYSATGIKGVKKKGNSYEACIRTNGKTINLGYYSLIQKAGEAYDIMAISLFKDFASINYPNKIKEYRNTNIEEHKEKYSLSKKCISSFLGVSFDNPCNKFRARIVVNKKEKHIGLFDDELSAAKARDIYIIRNNLNNKLNFPRESYDEVLQNEKKMVVFKA